MSELENAVNQTPEDNNNDNNKKTAEEKKEMAIMIAKKTGKISLRILSYLMNALMTIMLIGTTCAIIVGTVFCIYIANYVDPEIDSSLFAAASSDTTTRMYYMSYEDEDARINQDGVPVELEEQRLYSSDNSIWVGFDEMPQDLIDAFTSVEDHRFFSHNGVDWLRTGSAVFSYFFGDGDFGGSTITQQLVKNLTGDNENSVQRKVQEIFRALHLEQQMSKEDIIEMYLNIVYLGNNCYGVQAAANTYFGKDVSELSLVECASLAAVVKNPSKYEPLYHDEFVVTDDEGNETIDGNKARRETVLYTMMLYDKISETEFDKAAETELVLLGEEGSNGADSTPTASKNKVTSWYTDAVIEDVQKALMEQYDYSEYVASLMIYTGGLQIYTCMDPEVQGVIDEVYINDGKDDGYFPYATDGLQPESSIIVIDPYTGDVLGLAGGRGEKAQSRILNRATQAKRPCGSSIKPISVYAPAIDAGVATMGSVYDDSPVTTAANGTMWPHNLPDVYNGYTTIHDAIRRSVNTVAVKVLKDLGIDYSFDFMKNTLNMHSLIESYTTASGYVVSDKSEAPLALGQFSYGITLWELTAAYSIFPNDGIYCKSRLWYEVCDSNGNVILTNEPEYEMAISEESADVMTMMMEEVIKTGTGTAVTLDERVDVAGKTGTTTNDFDRTFIGYTPYYVCGCWFGYDMNQALSDFTKSPAAVVWDKVMTMLQEKVEARCAATGEAVKGFEYSDKLVKKTYCKDSGMLLGDACAHDPRGSRAETAYFTPETAPTETCDVHVLVDYDKVTGCIATDKCPEANIKKVALVRNETREFATQVYITDAQYVYRTMKSAKFPTYYGYAYFYYSIPEGKFVGKSPVEKQFNCACSSAH